ncbi:MAG: hypothetical protein LUC34_07495 [Campylobacter sp.]|nr:hypothetical protein [Campylobacter sp.]
MVFAIVTGAVGKFDVNLPASMSAQAYTVWRRCVNLLLASYVARCFGKFKSNVEI